MSFLWSLRIGKDFQSVLPRETKIQGEGGWRKKLTEVAI
ncbi:hypothetical protein COLO4_04979 [Corchorus olitorius]|uniref:Uncharacterized protein n=1 Tax=Corchorus olitorius TaxID=93759 RepID=A0A1R3KSA4_9ROSI|nr:hypothetical protein COLO4_04979 [Corchorus olitorius]